MTELITKSYNYELSEADEALLDMLEAEWLMRQQALHLEDYDYWTNHNSYKAKELQ